MRALPSFRATTASKLSSRLPLSVRIFDSSKRCWTLYPAPTTTDQSWHITPRRRDQRNASHRPSAEPEQAQQKLANDLHRAVPARFIEDMDNFVEGEGHAVSDAGLVNLIGGCLEGPVKKEWPTENILARDKAPVATVEGGSAGVAHGEDP